MFPTSLLILDGRMTGECRCIALFGGMWLDTFDKNKNAKQTFKHKLMAHGRR
jgi:hypothetical protein